MLENKEKRREKSAQKKEEKEILELRRKELGVRCENGKEAAQILTWKGKDIGKYTGPGWLAITISKFRHNLLNLERINQLVEKAAPLKAFNLYKGLSNWCACGQIDLETSEFSRHVREHHRGVVLKDSQINRPPWTDWVFYENEQLEEELLFSKNNLDNYFINNN